MTFWTDNFHIRGTSLGGETKSTGLSAETKSTDLLFNNFSSNTPLENEITLIKDVKSTGFSVNYPDKRSKYLKITKNPIYKVQKGDNPDTIAKKFGIETTVLLAANGLDKSSALSIKIGQELTIPPTVSVKNVKKLDDVASAMGLSKDFVLRLKRQEDGESMADNEFHNTPYKDKSGVTTIGIGHVLLSGDKTKLSDSEVCTLLVKDLLKVENNLIYLMGGQKNYDKLPQPLKEALIDMAFNKGIGAVERTEGLLWCLKNEKYEAAINKFTNIKSDKTKKEMSGLAKRRLFEISVALKIYDGEKIPQTNINTVQTLYNKGVELLRAECKKNKSDFTKQLAGYNKEIQGYFGNKISLKLIKE